MPQTQVEWEKIADEFHKNGIIPSAYGHRRKHIAIRPPANSGSPFYNYKHFFSLVLLVDANYKFIYVNVGANGRTGDAGGIHP